MDTSEKRVSGEILYKGKILTLRRDQALTCEGQPCVREVVEHNGGVCILPVDAEGNCYLVRQFRYPYMRMVLEAPAGKREGNEPPIHCAVRELSEETGFTAKSYTSLGTLLPSPGYTNEVIYIYLATDLEQGECHPDEDEYLHLEKYPLTIAVEMVMNGEIEDAKTISAILKADRILHK